MRVSFLGTPETSAAYLEALARHHEVVAVVTQPDRPRGRSGEPQPSPVRALADELGVRVLQPEKGQCLEACRCVDEEGPRYCIVVAFGQKLPCLSPGGCMRDRGLNVHYSLLPKLRGAAPVQHALLQGLETTGVTVQHVAPGFDEGDIIAQRELAILPEDTCGSLTERLTAIGVEALLEALEGLEAGTATRRAQDGSQATWAPLVRKSDGLIRWDEPAELIARKVRAYTPWPGASTTLRGKPLRVVRASFSQGAPGAAGEPGVIVEMTPDYLGIACAEGVLRIEELQPAGKRALCVAEFLRGARLEAGEALGT